MTRTYYVSIMDRFARARWRLHHAWSVHARDAIGRCRRRWYAYRCGNQQPLRHGSAEVIIIAPKGDHSVTSHSGCGQGRGQQRSGQPSEGQRALICVPTRLKKANRDRILPRWR